MAISVISMMLMAAGRSYAIPDFDTLTPDTWANTGTGPRNSEMAVQVNQQRLYETFADNAEQNVLLNGYMEDCEVYVTEVTGTFDSGDAVDTWHDLAVTGDLSFGVSQTTTGTTFCDFTIEIREKADTGNTTGAVAFTVGATRTD
jgi:hypothetical protein